jgi:hypothetical protein
MNERNIAISENFSKQNNVKFCLDRMEHKFFESIDQALEDESQVMSQGLKQGFPT